jgi:hypothetical protein
VFLFVLDVDADNYRRFKTGTVRELRSIYPNSSFLEKLSILRYCPAKLKMGRNWYQSSGIALVLGCWTFFIILKGQLSEFCKKCFAAT